MNIFPSITDFQKAMLLYVTHYNNAKALLESTQQQQEAMMSSINQVISATKSFIARSEGCDVAVFHSETSDLVTAIEGLGFIRNFRKGTNTESHAEYSTNQFLNDKEESVFVSYGNDQEWTFCGSDCEPVTAASLVAAV